MWFSLGCTKLHSMNRVAWLKEAADLPTALLLLWRLLLRLHR